MTVQTTYDVNPGRGFRRRTCRALGSALCRLRGAPCAGRSVTHIPTAGDAVYWDTTENAFAVADQRSAVYPRHRDPDVP